MEEAADARKIFPLEIWNIILFQLDNYPDVQSVQEAFPELTGLPRGIRPCWKIDTVMPLLFPKYLDAKDLLKCRILSKKWKNAIYVTIANHQALRPYGCSNENALCEQHFNYFPLPVLSLRQKKFLTAGHDGTIPWTQYPRTSKVLLCPQLYGHSIRRFAHNIKSDDSRQSTSIIGRTQALLNNLQFLPNLESFKLSCNISYIIDTRTNWNIYAVTIPAKVETLQLPTFDRQNPEFSKMLNDVFFETFVNHDQVKKFGLDLDHWKETYMTRLPNLTELHCSVYHSGTEFLDKISHFLRNTKEEQHPKKLRMYLPILMIYGFLEILVPYKIEALDLCVERFRLAERDNFDSLSVPSVTTLMLYVLKESPLQFLKCLPNLQFLSVVLDEKMFNENLPNETDFSPFAMCLRRYVLENRTGPGNFHCIWTEFPKLKMLTVYSHTKYREGELKISRQYLAENKNKAFSSLAQLALV